MIVKTCLFFLFQYYNQNVQTVQGLIQEKISKLLKEKIIIYGAGRLDSGVHAKEQSAHFDYNIEIKKKERF